MMKPSVKIGFVPTYRHYGDSAMPEWCAQMRADLLSAFAGVPGMQVLAPMPSAETPPRVDAQQGCTLDGAIWNFDQAEAMAEYFRREGVDGILIAALDFGDERSACKVAELLRVPVLLVATKEPPVPAGPSLARTSDSYCGTLSIASGLYRRKLAFHYAGIFFAEDPQFCAEVETFVRAVAVVKGLQGARIGQVGVRPATFETVGYDEAAMIRKFGQNVIYTEVSEVVARAQRYPQGDARVQAVAADIAAEVAEVSVSDTYLDKAARMELALTEFFERNRLSAMAMQCWPAIQQTWGFSTCALFGRMTGKGMLTACEVDILGALSMIVNYQAALGETLPHFVDWTIQHREDENMFLSWHCGNAPTVLAADPAKTALRSRGDMQGSQPVEEDNSQAGLYQFQIRPGTVTFCRLAEYDNQWKMLIAVGEIVPSDETLAGTWAWVRLRDHQRLYRTLVEEGFIHHASMSHGDQSAVLKLACKFLDIQAVVVD